MEIKEKQKEQVNEAIKLKSIGFVFWNTLFTAFTTGLMLALGVVLIIWVLWGDLLSWKIISIYWVIAVPKVLYLILIFLDLVFRKTKTVILKNPSHPGSVVDLCRLSNKKIFNLELFRKKFTHKFEFWKAKSPLLFNGYVSDEEYNKKIKDYFPIVYTAWGAKQPGFLVGEVYVKIEYYLFSKMIKAIEFKTEGSFEEKSKCF